MAELNLSLIKEHPYATGAVVIVGGLVVLYLLSSSQSSQAPAQASSDSSGMSSSDYQAMLAAQSQNAQVAAAAQVQNNAQQVALQQQQLEAQVANGQTAAAIHTNDVNTSAQLAATLAQIQADAQSHLADVTAATTDTANQYMYAQNLQQMQDQVLESQINSGVLENANNNATALAGLMSSNDLQALISKLEASTATTIASIQGDVASKGVDAATTVQLQQLQDQYSLSDKTLNMVQQAGLNHGTESLETSLVGVVGAALGQPGVATAAVTGNSAAAVASSQSTANIVNSISSGLSSVVNGLFAKKAA